MMNHFSMAVRNLKNNFSFYALYLVSAAVVITIYFAFTSFSMNRVMLEKISGDGRVESMCSVISACLMIFVVFYMSYSNRFFLRRRTKELGIYALLGYRRSAILLLLTVENILVCVGSLATGLILGAILHKGIVYGITVLLNLTVDNSQIPFLNLRAVANTVRFILLVILVMVLSNTRFVFRSSLMDLVRFEKSAEKKLKFKKIPAALGFLFIVGGYGLALDIFRGARSLWMTFGFYPTGLLTFMLIAAGTVLFISSFLPFAVQVSKRNKRAFYTETKVITMPNFVYRIRSNAKTLIMLTLLSAAALSVSSVMALSMYYPIAAVSRMAPSELEMRVENEKQEDMIRELVSEYVPVDHVVFTRTDIFKVTAEGDNLPAEYSVGTSKGDADNERLLRTAGFECISYTQYIALLQAQNKEAEAGRLPVLEDDECILVKYQPNADGSEETGAVYPLNIHGNITPLTVCGTTLNNPVSFANSVGTLIVSDQVYEEMRRNMAVETCLLSINGTALENNEELFATLKEALRDSPYLQGHTHRIHEIFSLNSSTFLLIGFLVVLFFIATGSILYFNNVSAVSDSKGDYEILDKMGYSKKKLKKIIRKQTRTFFLIPFSFGLLDCIFATIVYKTGLMQNLLGNKITLYVPTFLAIALTALIYIVYYWITVRSCCKMIFGMRSYETRKTGSLASR